MVSLYAATVASTLEAVVNHLTLPPRLPGQQDSSLVRVEPILVTYLIDATKRLDFDGSLDCLRHSLQTSQLINTGRRLQKSSLLKAFRELLRGEFLILQVVEQNAAVIIRRDHG